MIVIAAGQRVGDRYLLDRRIAIGGMGEVWEASDSLLGRSVAVKILRPELSGDPEFLHRFRIEARTVASLDHDGIAAVHDYGESDGVGGRRTAYLVMELVRGEPLSTHIARGPIEPDETLRLLEEAAWALQAAHERGFVHRDVKPGNILVRTDGKVKLTDFGIAKAADAVPVTRSGMVMGTAHYIAPEQASGAEAGPAGDVYSLGIVGYECLVGHRPFRAESAVAVAMMQVRDEPPPLPDTVPIPARELIEATLVKDPTLRYSTGGEFAAAVAAIRRGEAVPLPAALAELVADKPATGFTGWTRKGDTRRSDQRRTAAGRSGTGRNNIRKGGSSAVDTPLPADHARSPRRAHPRRDPDRAVDRAQPPAEGATGADRAAAAATGRPLGPHAAAGALRAADLGRAGPERLHPARRGNGDRGFAAVEYGARYRDELGGRRGRMDHQLPCVPAAGRASILSGEPHRPTDRRSGSRSAAPRPGAARHDDHSTRHPQESAAMTTPRLLSERYELGEVLGFGGMSEVHRGLDTRLSRDVAIKVLRADLARDPQFQIRFRREAQNAAALNHPAIVAVYDTGEVQSDSGPLPYIVMEYVDGQTLREIVKTTGPMTQQKVIEVMADVCAALDFSHRHQIIHRDVKPANIMINRAGAVKVMDFGIARALGEGQNVTQTAAVIGTAQYLSPEQARGEAVDARSDVYAVGCVLFELLTGEPPFTGDSPVAVAYQHVREDPRAPSELNPEISPALDAVVLKALSKNPLNRYQSAAEMRADLVRVRSGQSPMAPVVMSQDERTAMLAPAPPTGPTRRLNGGAARAGAAGALLRRRRRAAAQHREDRRDHPGRADRARAHRLRRLPGAQRPAGPAAGGGAVAGRRDRAGRPQPARRGRAARRGGAAGRIRRRRDRPGGGHRPTGRRPGQRADLDQPVGGHRSGAGHGAPGDRAQPGRRHRRAHQGRPDGRHPDPDRGRAGPDREDHQFRPGAGDQGQGREPGQPGSRHRGDQRHGPERGRAERERRAEARSRTPGSPSSARTSTRAATTARSSAPSRRRARQAKKGSEVTLQISSGNNGQRPVPNVVGAGAERRRAAAARLRLHQDQHPQAGRPCTRQLDGRVVAQTPAGRAERRHRRTGAAVDR